MYLINLILANFLHFITAAPLDLSTTLMGNWPLNYAACTFCLYAGYIINAAIPHSHMLVTLNRIWAVTFPVSYRHYHTGAMAASLCLAMWLYIHALLPPQLIRDALYYRFQQNVPFCWLNAEHPAQWRLVLFTEFWCYIVPQTVMFTGYPYIMYKRRRRLQFSAERRDGTQPSGTTNPPASKNLVAAPASRPSTGYRVLTILTLTAFVCWIPSMVYFKLNLLNGYQSALFYQVGGTMVLLQAAADPLYIALSVKGIRAILKTMICCGT
ncbi:muscarinic acetylcholine receptor gar-3-like [Paramacrobiotus metropolitanus]|uniref:muscarinic acetylcholine receptor gar-3-like n=1 Tax=Paramacrobiotus metropolitanus TaxID=2943436 RepID=UPI0024461215|nr:muscarinic acetylcholine receptor gar-3-like [Paramacrobiotus metropolitanus]